MYVETLRNRKNGLQRSVQDCCATLFCWTYFSRSLCHLLPMFEPCTLYPGPCVLGRLPVNQVVSFAVYHHDLWHGKTAKLLLSGCETKPSLESWPTGLAWWLQFEHNRYGCCALWTYNIMCYKVLIVQHCEFWCELLGSWSRFRFIPLSIQSLSR